MLLCEDIADQRVLLGSKLSDEQEKTLLRFLFNKKMSSLGQLTIYVVLTEMSLSIHSTWIDLSGQGSKDFGKYLRIKLKVLRMK